MESNYVEEELRFLCEKMPLIGYEGYAESPLPNDIYEKDRDE